MIKIGPAGIGGAKEAKDNIKHYRKSGLKAVEIAFTYGVYLKKKDALRIGEFAKVKDVDLSIHAPYYINLDSDDKKKIEASKKRILKCCETGNILGAKYIVFHAAFYGKSSPEKCYEQVKKEIIDMQKVIKEKNWRVKLAPETTGKRSQFGSLDELLKLAKETKCHFTIDFAHIKARNNGKIDYDDVMKKLRSFGKHIHAHFSGIEYTEKGERRHLITDTKEIKELLKYIKKYKLDITLINESPNPVGDAIKTIKLLK